MAKDKLHEIVREVLVVDGWYVSHDPYLLSEYDPAWEIDFAAEKNNCRTAW